MKKRFFFKALVFVLLAFIVNEGYSQDPVFNLETNKLYKIKIIGVNDYNKADLISRQMEKMQLSVFSFVDYQTGIGYFIVENSNMILQVINVIPSVNGCSVNGSEELLLNKESLMNIYMRRSGISENEIPIKKPYLINIGPNMNLANTLFSKVFPVWEEKYAVEYNKSLGLPGHYPILFETGNSENDKIRYEEDKQFWIKNYPDEVQQATGRGYKSVTGFEYPKNVEKMNSSNK